MPMIGVSVGVGHRRRGFRPLALFDALASTSLPAWLSHSRAGNATMFDSTGKLTYAPNNLLTQSNTFSNAAWTRDAGTTLTSGATDPLGGTNAWTFTSTSGANNQIYSAVNTLTGNMIQSLWVKRRTGSGTISLRDAAGGSTVLAVTGTWTQFYNAAASSGAARVAIIIATAGDAIDIYAAGQSAVTYETTPRAADQVITTSAAYYGPRIDYDPNTLAVKGLLIEEARTNYWKNSNSPASWSPISASQLVTANATTSPDGTSNASLIYIANGTGLLAGYNPRPSLPAGNSTLTIFAKQAAWKYLFIGLLTGATDYAVVQFDVSTGAVQRQAATGANFTIVGTPTATLLNNGWYRLQVVVNSVPANPFAFVMPYGTAWSAGAPPYNNATGDGSSGVYVYGVQGEPGAFGTSYTAAAAASVTRAADALSAASLTTNPAIIQYRDLATGTRARKVINPWSGISSETNEWIEGIRIYPLGTSPTWLNAHLTVDGAW